MFGDKAIVSFYADSHYGIVMLFNRHRKSQIRQQRNLDAMPA